jgi:hypothetical protein
VLQLAIALLIVYRPPNVWALMVNIIAQGNQNPKEVLAHINHKFVKMMGLGQIGLLIQAPPPPAMTAKIAQPEMLVMGAGLAAGLP